MSVILDQRVKLKHILQEIPIVGNICIFLFWKMVAGIRYLYLFNKHNVWYTLKEEAGHATAYEYSGKNPW